MKGEIKTQKLSDGIILISLRGSFMGQAIEDLDLALKAFFDRAVYKFIIDLSEIHYLPSSVASIFIKAASRVQENKGKIVFVQSMPAEDSVFGILGLANLYQLTNDLPSALAAFK